MQVIPAIDLIEGRCVRLFQGDYQRSTVYEGDPGGQALRFQEAGFERLHVVDLEGARSGSGQNRTAIRGILETCCLPVQVGGGIRSAADVGQLLDWGARFLILGTVLLHEPETVGEWIRIWGPDPFIASLDLRGGRLQAGGWIEESAVALEEMRERIGGWGISQVIVTDVERDGTLDQPNYRTCGQLREMLPETVGLIAAGGVSRPEHVERLARIGLTGAVVGRALYEGTVPWEAFLNASKSSQGSESSKSSESSGLFGRSNRSAGADDSDDSDDSDD